MYIGTSGGLIHQMIPRLNDTAVGVFNTGSLANCYNISVVDWEEDGSTGSQAVPITVISSEGKRFKMQTQAWVSVLHTVV